MTKFATLNLKNGVAVEENIMELDINSIPSSDPLAFGYGLHKGKFTEKEKIKMFSFKDLHGSKYSELAPEYLRGFLAGFREILVPEGTKIKMGQETSLALSHLNLLKNDKKSKLR